MTYFPDQQYFDRSGHLFPWDVRFDPSDVAHLARTAAGAVRFRLLAETGFASATVVFEDGSGHDLAKTPGSHIDMWEAVVAPPSAQTRFTFALLRETGQPVYRVPAGVTNGVERLDRWELDVAGLREVTVPQWARGAVIYQVFPDRFRRSAAATAREDLVAWGSDPGWLGFQGGDLAGIAERIPYLVELGVDCLYLNPIFRSPSTHRYDCIDYYEVDPHLGGNEALRSLVDAAHDQDIKVIVDASFNHCHPRFFAFADVVANGRESPYWSWFDIRSYPIEVQVRPAAVRSSRWSDPETYLEHMRRFEREAGVPVIVRDDDGPPVSLSYDAWYGAPSLPRIDLTNPAARAYFLDVATHWIEEYDIDGWRMDVTRYVDAEFWPAFRDAVKGANPDAYLLAEVMGDAVPWLQGDQFDATMNYTFRQLALDYLSTDSIDGAGLADGLVRMYAMLAPEIADSCQNLLGSHDKPRFLHKAGGDTWRLHLATLLQLTVPGAPGLYYGDEIALGGRHDREGREAFPWDDVESWDGDQLAMVRALTALRRERSSLRRGGFRPLWHHGGALAFAREAEGERTVVVLSRDAEVRNVTLPVPAGTCRLLWGDGAAARIDGELVVSVPARGGIVVAC